MSSFRERLLKALKYDPETGQFTWRIYASGQVAGQQAGSINPKGYLVIKFEQRMYQAGRLAWYISYGVWPTGIVDHKNETPLDNRLDNLRDTTYSMNRVNIAAASSRNLSGLRGVTSVWNGSFVAKFKGKNLGTFRTPEDAHVAYLEAKSLWIIKQPKETVNAEG